MDAGLQSHSFTAYPNTGISVLAGPVSPPAAGKAKAGRVTNQMRFKHTTRQRPEDTCDDQMRKVLRIMAVVTVVVVVLSVLGSCGGLAIKTCEDLAPHIIELSKEKGPYNAQILKFYDIRRLYDIKKNNTQNAKTVIDCTATAKTDRTPDATINFYLEEDADGDRFIGYRQI